VLIAKILAALLICTGTGFAIHHVLMAMNADARPAPPTEPVREVQYSR
jgi:hypothetical protein